MPIITIVQVAEHISDVTGEQISKCTRLIGPDDQAYYSVENERGDMFEGDVITYAVRYNCMTGFSCTCPAGAAGFVYCRNASGVCKHVRWVVAAIMEERGYFAELAAAEARRREEEETGEVPAAAPEEKEACHTPLTPPDWYDPMNATSFFFGTRSLLIKTGSKECSDATYARVMLAQPKQPDEREVQREIKEQAIRQQAQQEFWAFLNANQMPRDEEK